MLQPGLKSSIELAGATRSRRELAVKENRKKLILNQETLRNLSNDKTNHFFITQIRTICGGCPTAAGMN